MSQPTYFTLKCYHKVRGTYERHTYGDFVTYDFPRCVAMFRRGSKWCLEKNIDSTELVIDFVPSPDKEYDQLF